MANRINNFPLYEPHHTDTASRVTNIEREMTVVERSLYLLELRVRRMEANMPPRDPSEEDDGLPVEYEDEDEDEEDPQEHKD